MIEPVSEFEMGSAIASESVDDGSESLHLTSEQISAMQDKSLEMFNYLWDFCQQHGLTVYFCGGCCIGALRHQGFIPWDDDVDVFMPRPDYERLAELWPEHADIARYEYVRSTQDMVTGDLMAKICDVNTTCISAYQRDKDIPQGLTLDILPLDGYPESAMDRRLQLAWAYLFSLFCAQSVPVRHGGLMAIGARILLGLFRGAGSRYRIWRFAEKRMSRTPYGSTDSVTELCAGPGYMRNRYPTAAFVTARSVPFEGQLAPIPVGAETYLGIAFGDYLQLPPVEKRVPPHAPAFLDLNTPYRHYRSSEYYR